MKRPLRGWRLLLFARCDHASKIDSDEWDGPVDVDRWWAARLHRLSCGPCRREHRGFRWLRRLLASAPQSFKQAEAESGRPCLSPDAAERIRDAIAAAQADEDPVA